MQGAGRPPRAENIGPYTYIQPPGGSRLTQDPLLLAEFVLPLQEEDNAIDLGTGAGIIPLVLAWKTPARRITGVELEPASAEAARRNVLDNGLSKRVQVIESDWRGLSEEHRGEYSVVLANPPYRKAGAGRTSPDPAREVARAEVFGTLSDLINAASTLVSGEGRVAFVFTADRLFEMLEGIRGAGLCPRRLRFVHTAPDRKAKLFLVEAKVRRGELVIEDPVYL